MTNIKDSMEYLLNVNLFKKISSTLDLEFKQYSLKKIPKDGTNAYEINDDTVYFYPINDGYPTCYFEFVDSKGKTILNNRINYMQLLNLDDILLTMVRMYNKSLDEGIVLDPYFFMLRLSGDTSKEYYGPASLIITEKAIRNHKLNDDNFDEANKYFINLFLDHFIGWNYGVSVNRNNELRKELEELNYKVIELGLREYAGGGIEVVGYEDEPQNGVQHYKLPTHIEEHKKTRVI